MLLIAVLVLLGFTPGLYTAWRMHARHGWVKAALAGIGVTVLGAAALLSTLIVVTPLTVVCAAVCLLLALRAYDRGRLITATAWTSLAMLFSALAGWPR